MSNSSSSSSSSGARKSAGGKTLKVELPYWAILYGFTAVTTALLIKCLIRVYAVEKFSSILMLQSILSIAFLYMYVKPQWTLEGAWRFFFGSSSKMKLTLPLKKAGSASASASKKRSRSKTPVPGAKAKAKTPGAGGTGEKPKRKSSPVK